MIVELVIIRVHRKMEGTSKFANTVYQVLTLFMGKLFGGGGGRGLVGFSLSFLCLCTLGYWHNLLAAFLEVFIVSCMLLNTFVLHSWLLGLPLSTFTLVNLSSKAYLAVMILASSYWLVAGIFSLSSFFLSSSVSSQLLLGTASATCKLSS